MQKFMVEGDSRPLYGVALSGDRLEVEAADEDAAIAAFKAIVPGSEDWTFDVTAR